MKAAVIGFLVLVASVSAGQYNQVFLDTKQAQNLAQVANTDLAMGSAYFSQITSATCDVSTACQMTIDLAWNQLSGAATGATVTCNAVVAFTFDSALFTGATDSGSVQQTFTMTAAQYSATRDDTGPTATAGCWVAIGTAGFPLGTAPARRGEVAGLMQGSRWDSWPTWSGSVQFNFDVSFGGFPNGCGQGIIGTAYSSSYSQTYATVSATYQTLDVNNDFYNITIYGGSFSYAGLSSTGVDVAAHIHTGAKRCTGSSGVLASLGTVTNRATVDLDGLYDGSFPGVSSSSPYTVITTAQLNMFYCGLPYIVVHSPTKPSGEMRGHGSSADTGSATYPSTKRCGWNYGYSSCPDVAAVDTSGLYPEVIRTVSTTPVIPAYVCAGNPITPISGYPTTVKVPTGSCGGSAGYMSAAGVATISMVLIASLFSL